MCSTVRAGSEPTGAGAERASLPADPAAARLVHNGDRLVRTRLLGFVAPAAANQVVDHAGRLVVRPGQGGVVLGVGVGDPADPWASDHLEPGASLVHPDPAANHGLQAFSCLGNAATVVSGPASGARGVVAGKHGATLVAFAPADLARIAPGDSIVIDGLGVGLAIEGEVDVALHSCSPDLLERLVRRMADGRLRVRVAATLPAETAAAGLGMDVARFNIDLQVDAPAVAEISAELRFGDVVAVLDQDHRFGRQVRAGWIVIGVIAHGHSVGGGHGLGMVSLLSGPAARFVLDTAADASLVSLVRFPWLP
jgi:hypothetical protein